MLGIDRRGVIAAVVCAGVVAGGAAGAATAADSAGAPVLPLTAGANCQVNGEYGPDSEWSLIVKKRTNISCTGAKAVIRSCGKKSKVNGWKVSVKHGIVFTKTDGSRKFTAMGAGGSPKCVAAAYGA
ncbi:MAG: hypothetical protein PGN13_05070 [Patulibacter minatonensis]